MSPTQSQVALAVSTVIFALRQSPQGKTELVLPLVKRIREPYKGQWALPGGPLNEDEGLAEAASRTLRQTTGLEPRYLEQLYAFGQPDRSPSDRVVSIVYWALVGSDEANQVLDSPNVHWFTADELEQLAFDHNLIVEYALWRLRTKLEYSRVAHGFLGEEFTLAQLREVYEVILGKELDPGNFRRSVESTGAVIPTGSRVSGTRHRPPMLYRSNSEFDLTDHGPLTRMSSGRTPASPQGETR